MRCDAEVDNNDSPLDWWKLDGKRFPQVAKVARVVLPVPASSAPCERVFSKLGRMCAKERANMKPELVDVLAFVGINSL